MMSAAMIARAMGGRVERGGALVPGPNHSASDRSLRVFPDSNAPGGFRVHSFANDDPLKCRDYVRSKLGLPAWEPSRDRDHPGGWRQHTNGHIKPVAQDDLPSRTLPDADGKPKFFRGGGDEGPARTDDELRRHIYRRDGSPVRIKIKRTGGGFVQWYRVLDGDILGWQAKKPDGYRDIPYIGAVDPFDSELARDTIFWPEGEKDCDTLGKIYIPAFTFGGVGDGLPDTAAEFLAGRHLVILSDNDDQGRNHAERKAALARGVGAASIKIVHFSELPPHGDVSDFIAGGATAGDLAQRADAAPIWHATHVAERPAPEHGRALVMVQANVIEMVPVAWLWPGKMALGKLSLIAGEPGLGKSQLAAALGATVTTGGQWPHSHERAPLGSVVIFSAEDDASDTIVPRLKSAGADLERIQIVSAVKEQLSQGAAIERSFSLQVDLPLLERAIQNLGDVRLIIIDPITSYLGRVDSHKNAEIRSVLEPVAHMAARHGAAVVGITHFSKGGGTSAINRFIGSIGFIAAARAAFVVTIDPDSDDLARRLFMPVKNNLAARGDGLSFRIEQSLLDNGIAASRIEWGSDTVMRTADEILQATAAENDSPSKAEAEDFLRDALADSPRLAKEIESEAKEAGIAWRTVRRAQKALGIRPERRAESGDGLGKTGRWYWSLPPKMAKNPYVGHAPDVATLGKRGHLRDADEL
jgi:putative DNA primase/helicase